MRLFNPVLIKNESSLPYTVFVYIILILFNISTVGSILNLIITIPQIIYVLYLIFKKKYNEAILAHFVFIITSITATTAIITSRVYNYASLKIIGSLSYSYLISILLFVLTYYRKHIEFKLNGLLKIFLFLAVTGSILGIYGLMFKEYYFEYFIIHSFYIVILIINLFLLRNNNSIDLISGAYYNALSLLIASPIATTISLLLGIHTMYGDFAATIQSEIDFYSICLLCGIYYIKRAINKVLAITAVCCLFFFFFFAGGGREIIILLVGLLAFIYVTYTKNRMVAIKEKKITKRIVTTLMIIGIFAVVGSGVFSNKESIFYYKFEDVRSIFNVLIEEDVDILHLSSYIATSPYVRVASLINIVYMGQDNIINLLFGQGYGGYFEDKLGLFSHLHNLEDGGWPLKYVQDGRFPYAHDSFAIIPLLNGIIGLILIMWISITYIRRIKINYMYFAVVPFLLISFYFSITYAVVGVFLLFASQYNFNRSKS